MTDAAGEQKTGPDKPVSTGVKYILTAGAVATALAAIIGLGQTLLPDDPKPAERLSATISELQVDPRVPLAEYLEDVPEAAPESGQKAAVSGPLFASASGAQSTPAVVSSPPPATEPKIDPEGETEPPVTTPTPPPPPPTTTTTTPSPPPHLGPTGDERPLRGLPKRTATLLAQVESKPLLEVVEAPTEVRMERLTSVLTDDEDASPREVRQMLTSTRLQIANTKTAPPKLSPLGVVVNFSARIDGYRGKQSVVRWSLFDARERTRMPQSWLRNREAMRLVPEAGSDRGSLAVWVPLPRRRGPYFVRLELLDDRGGRLDMADTKSFDR